MTIFPIEPFDALNGNTTNACRVVGVDATHLQPEFIVMETHTDGWTFLTRAQNVERIPDEEARARGYLNERYARRNVGL